MSKKKLDESAILNELKGNSLFFQSQKTEVQAEGVTLSEPATPVVEPQAKRPSNPRKVKPQDTQSETTTPRYHDTVVPSYQEEMIETIRKAVKHLGKEAATYRFTEEEKKALSDIVYAYKGTGIRTSENELTRTAINFLVEDYRVNGKNSILARVLERLND